MLAKLSPPESVFPLLLRSAGPLQLSPSSAEVETRMSESVCAAPARFSSDSQMTTQFPAASEAIWGQVSSPVSVVPFVLRSVGTLQLLPLSPDTATKMSASAWAVPARFSVDSQTTIHRPVPLVAIRGFPSAPTSLPPFVFNTAGVVHVRPLFVEVATKMSSSLPAPARSSSDLHTATQFPASSVASWGRSSDPRSPLPLVFKRSAVVRRPGDQDVPVGTSQSAEIFEGRPNGDPVA